MNDDEEFKGDFDYWWEGAEDLIELRRTELIKLRRAFFEVLSKIPEADRDRFFAHSPKVVCNRNLGRVFQIIIAVPPSVPKDRLLVELTGIYLRYDILKRKRFLHLLAHEIAHIVRGDHKRRGVLAGTGHEIEKAADDLSHSWGFNRCYSRNMLKQLKRAPTKILFRNDPRKVRRTDG